MKEPKIQSIKMSTPQSKEITAEMINQLFIDKDKIYEILDFDDSTLQNLKVFAYKTIIQNKNIDFKDYLINLFLKSQYRKLQLENQSMKKIINKNLVYQKEK